MVDRSRLLCVEKYKLLLMLAMLYVCSTGAAFGQGKAFAALKPERVETGDTFSLIVIVSDVKSQPKSVDFAPWADLFPRQNILKQSDWRRSGTQWVQQFTLIAFDSILLELPALSVLLPAGKPLITNALTLNVYPTRFSDPNDPEPIRDIFREPISWLDYWPWATGVFCIMAVLFWLIRSMFRRPQPVIIPIPIPLPSISASEIALRKLDELQSLQLWKKGELKEHYAALSLIIRAYLETQYSIAALESTTAEIMPLLVSTNLPATQLPFMREILHQTDMVKYAKSKPADNRHEAVLEKARMLITPNYQQQSRLKKEPAGKIPPPKPGTNRYEPL